MSAKRPASTAWTEEAAREFLERSEEAGRRRLDDLDIPWRLALTVIRHDRRRQDLVIDVASGPGGFLAVALEMAPEAEGIWFDFSETMQERALTTLRDQLSRVRFQLADFSELGQVAPASSIDAVLTSRATHHLTLESLDAFYRDAANLLKPGGWLANLDLMPVSPEWTQRLVAARTELRQREGGSTSSSHDHPNRMPTLEEHRKAAQQAGFEPAQEIWRLATTCMVLARKPG